MQMPVQQAPQVSQTHQVPVIQAQPVIQQTQDTGRQKSQRLTKVGIVACIVAVLVLIATLLLVFLKPFGLFEEQLDVDRPSMTQVEEAYNNATMPEPNLSSFAYVNDSGLEKKGLDGFNAEEVKYSKDNGRQEAYCEATAEAKYENQSVSVTQTLSMRMDYDKKNEQWTAGSVRETAVAASPESAPDIEAIVADFPNILQSYNSQLAQLYSGAQVSQISTLTAKGGSATFTLTKANADGTSLTCTANAEITWSDTKGWVVQIVSVDGDIAAPEPPAQETPSPEESQGESSGEAATPEATNPPASDQPSSGGSGQPTMQLVCWSGDLVEVPGTIQFDNSGRVLLKTDDIIKVIFDDTVFITTYFEILGTSSFQNGQHRVIRGAISATGTLSQAPLVINTNYE